MAANQILFLLFIATASSAGAAGGRASTEFIHARCSATLYPDLCYRSLASYANTIQSDPIRLARSAANVTLARIRTALKAISPYTTAADARTAAAVRDCAESLGDAAGRTRDSLGELARLEAGAVGPEVALRVSNAETWMSAALTCEETCTDGFNEVGGGTVGEEVCGRVGRVKEFTSNALALVNHLVAS